MTKKFITITILSLSLGIAAVNAQHMLSVALLPYHATCHHALNQHIVSDQTINDGHFFVNYCSGFWSVMLLYVLVLVIFSRTLAFLFYSIANGVYLPILDILRRNGRLIFCQVHQSIREACTKFVDRLHRTLRHTVQTPHVEDRSTNQIKSNPLWAKTFEYPY